MTYPPTPPAHLPAFRTASRDNFLNVRANGRVVHRLALFDDYGAIVTVISQLDVIKWVRGVRWGARGVHVGSR